jgi:hypothetical protein
MENSTMKKGNKHRVCIKNRNDEEWRKYYKILGKDIGNFINRPKI